MLPTSRQSSGQFVVSANRLQVALVALKQASASILYGLHEVLGSVGSLWNDLTGQADNARATFAPFFVAEESGPIDTRMGLSLQAAYCFGDSPAADIVIVPGLAPLEGIPDGDEWQTAGAFVRTQFQRDAIVCSVCNGAVLLAHAGLLDGEEATSHWSATSIIRERYPRVRLNLQRVLVPSGPDHRIVTSGGSASWAELALYLIARFSGQEQARRTAKIFHLGDRSTGQLPFAVAARPRQHEDETIGRVQAWIAEHYEVANPVLEMTRRSGLSSRTFKRRFLGSTGYNPLEYVQSLRIEEAKQLLESTDGTVDDIAREVGYEDAGSFRRLFKRRVGITPREYRRRFRFAGDLPADTPMRYNTG